MDFHGFPECIVYIVVDKRLGVDGYLRATGVGRGHQEKATGDRTWTHTHRGFSNFLQLVRRVNVDTGPENASQRMRHTFDTPQLVWPVAIRSLKRVQPVAVARGRVRLSAMAEDSVHISGSGSTLFIPCPDALHAGALSVAVREQLDLPTVAVTTCQLQTELLETIQ